MIFYSDSHSKRGAKARPDGAPRAYSMVKSTTNHSATEDPATSRDHQIGSLSPKKESSRLHKLRKQQGYILGHATGILWMKTTETRTCGINLGTCRNSHFSAIDDSGVGMRGRLPDGKQKHSKGVEGTRFSTFVTPICGVQAPGQSAGRRAVSSPLYDSVCVTEIVAASWRFPSLLVH